MEIAQTKYMKIADGVHIAYQVRGEGPLDLVYIVGGPGDFEVELEVPRGMRFVERLPSFSRVILFDKLGTGVRPESDAGLDIEDAGEHELKGVPDRWRLYRVVDV